MPPLATARVPARVIVPAPVIGPPLVVSPVVPPLTSMLVTVPTPPAGTHSTSVPPTLTASTLPALLAYVGRRLVRAPDALDAPVPPSVTARSVMPEIVPPVIVPPVIETLLAFWVDIVPSPETAVFAIAIAVFAAAVSRP